MSEEEKQSKVERRGPFYAPRQLTKEERKERDIKRKIKQAELRRMIKTGNYDKLTVVIADLVGKMNVSIAKIYLWRYKLWNLMFVLISARSAEALLGLFEPSILWGFVGFVVFCMITFIFCVAWVFKQEKT